MRRGFLVREQRKVASVAATWKRIDEFFAQHSPVILQTKRPGLSPESIADFESRIGQTLPDDVRESYLIHDGQIETRKYLSCGIVFGQSIRSLMEGDRCVLDEWSIAASGARDPYSDFHFQFDPQYTSSPQGFIKCQYANTAWLPLIIDAGGNKVGLDLDSGPRGHRGQVINYGPDEFEHHVLALSWGQFLEDLVDELDAGNFEIGDRYFANKWPEKGWSLTVGRTAAAWSRAKLPLEYQGSEV
jgi:cell wall assembly regulator SMI1